MWLSQECKKKYPRCTALASQKLISFPSSYLVECGFSVVADLLHAKRNQLEITKRGDLRLKLTKLEPRIKQLCSQHQAQGSHQPCYCMVSSSNKLEKLCVFSFIIDPAF